MSSKSKGADQLCSYCIADLHLFLHMQIVGFRMWRLISLYQDRTKFIHVFYML